MRTFMRAALFIALPGAIFAPLISAVHAVSFCRDWSGDGLLLLDDLPPCPSQPYAGLIVPLAIAAGAIMVAWNLAPLYTSRTTE